MTITVQYKWLLIMSQLLYSTYMVAAYLHTGSMLCCCVLIMIDINIQALPCKMLPGACTHDSSWL